MTIKINPRDLVAGARNTLHLDYISGAGEAADFFTHSPLDFTAALENRRRFVYPRRESAPLLKEYNAGLGAHSRALANIDALNDPSTFCVIAGQQAGFLGGPMYTVYKIITAIRLAAHLQQNLPGQFVPLFWLASEDHDFYEINHAYFLKRDGEVGKAQFRWNHSGRPIADLPITEEVKRAYNEYFESVLPGPHLSQTQEQFAFRPEEDFCTWQARIWSHLFSRRGLVIVEPKTLRPLASDFFSFALEQSEEIRRRLDTVSQRLESAGYTPSLTSEDAGRLYTFDPTRRRIRVKEPEDHIAEAATHPQLYSTDAALRSLFADTMLPIVASVLGPGEIAYQAMLKPLYDLFDLPQPLLFPRESYTILDAREAERITQYQTSASAILTGQLDTDAVFGDLTPALEWADAFDTARQGLKETLSPLRAYVEEIDPSLGRSWEHTLNNAMRGMDKLEQRAMKAHLSQLSFSRGELRALRNTLLPRNRLQERIFPLPHFINRHGIGFIDAIFSAGDLSDFSHHVLTLEAEHVPS